MDPLTEICASMRVEKAMFTRVEATAPWGISSPGERGVKFVLVVRGTSTLTMPDGPAPIVLRGGDVFITLSETPYEIYDEPGSRLLDCAEVLATQVDDTMVVGGGGAPTTFISGAFHIDDPDARPLFSVMPRFLLLRAEEERTRAFESVLDMLSRETGRRAMGFEAMIGRLFELLFIHAVRAYADQETAIPKRGWLGAISDAQLRDAVRAMHGDLAHDWTLESLAKQAGMSRSAFTARFKQSVGQTPLDYLTRWRMHRATQLLQRDGLSLAEIGRSVGYRSEAAFNRTFKRAIGATPGQYRRDLSAPKA